MSAISLFCIEAIVYIPGASVVGRVGVVVCVGGIVIILGLVVMLERPLWVSIIMQVLP